MKIGTPKEVEKGEARVAMTPDSAKALQKLGYDCLIEKGAGVLAGFADKDYEEAGVTVVPTAAALWKEADIIAKVRIPTETELKRLNKDKTLITFFNPGGKGLNLPRRRVPTSSRWKWCRGSRARRRWTRSARWRISQATGP